MQLRKLLLPLFALCAAYFQPTQAQDSVDIAALNDPLHYPQLIFGIDFGMPVGFGSFQSGCRCPYDGTPDGSSLGFQAGADFHLSSALHLSLRAALVHSTFRYGLQEEVPVHPYIPSLGNMMVDRSAEYTLFECDVALLLRWDLPFAGVFLAAGPSLFAVLSDHLLEQVRILSPDLVFSDGTKRATTFDGALSELRPYPGGKIADYTPDVVGIQFVLGYRIEFGTRWSVAPELLLHAALASHLRQSPHWKLTTVRAASIFRYQL